jgi:hypothetical protein
VRFSITCLLKILITLVGVIALGIFFISVMSAVRLHRYRIMPIEDTALFSLTDGTYRGEAFVRSYRYKVDVTTHSMLRGYSERSSGTRMRMRTQ